MDSLPIGEGPFPGVQSEQHQQLPPDQGITVKWFMQLKCNN